MTGVRFDYALGEFLGTCEDCRQRWPLTREYWPTSRFAVVCRACLVERHRDANRRYRERQRRLDEALIRRRIYKREWMRAHRARGAAA